MNAKACEHVSRLSLNYTPNKLNCLCALSQNSKTIQGMKKLKLSLNLKKNALSIIRKMNSIEQIIREIEANECKSL